MNALRRFANEIVNFVYFKTECEQQNMLTKIYREMEKDLQKKPDEGNIISIINVYRS